MQIKWHVNTSVKIVFIKLCCSYKLMNVEAYLL